MFTKDLTIINKIYDSNDEVSYVCTHVKGFWSSSRGLTLNGTDLIGNKTSIVRILMSEPGYVSPSNYNGNGWTLRNDDYIAKGIVNSCSSIKDLDEYIKITDVSIKDYGSPCMQHYEVSGE